MTLSHRIAARLGLRSTEASPRTALDEQLERGFERSIMPLALLDDEGRFVRVNHALCALLGHAEDDLLGKTALSVTHPDDRESTAARLRRGLVDHFDLEKRYVRADGSTVWCNATSTPIGMDGDEPCRYVQIVDITSRKEAEAQIASLLHEHGAVARVAQAVAAGAEPDEVYRLVAQQVAALLDADAGAVIRFDADDDTATCLATWAAPGCSALPPGTT